MFSITLVILFTLFSFVWLNNRKRKQTTLPKGPTGLPLLGNLLQVLLEPHKTFSKWAYQFGKVYTLNLCGKKVLVVNDANTMKEVFGTLESTGRYTVDMFLHATKGVNGLPTTEGLVAMEIRAFLIKGLKHCGFRRSNVAEPIIIGEIDNFIQWMETTGSENGKVESIRPKLVENLSNVTWQIMTRNSTAPRNTDVGKLVHKFFDWLQVTAKSGLVFLPWLKYIVPNWSGYNQFCAVCEEMDNLVQKYFDSHKAARVIQKPTAESADLIDAYLEQLETCTDHNSCFYGETGWKHSFYSVKVLLVTGGETMATHINWMINYLTAYPQVQAKLQQEVDTVIGSIRNPSIKDRFKMPYMEAFVMETLRKSSIGAFGLIHRLINDVQYEQYKLPKDTILIANIWHANHSSDTWQNPECFQPERFAEGNAIQKKERREAMASFQPGKRVCPGESFAKDALFVAAARLIQVVEFSKIASLNESDYTKPETGFLLLPPQVGICVRRRKQENTFVCQ